VAKWKPISTAPKDGTWIIVCCPDSPMCWRPCEFTAWMESDGVGSWREEDCSEDLPYEPTHWMPIPKVPKS